MSNRVETYGDGATRSDSSDRYDPEGYFSPIAWERISEYLQKHQFQADGTIRDSDNWQRGVPQERFMKGLWRHMLHLWARHRGYPVMDPNAGEDIEEDLCAIAWGAQAMLHFILKERFAEQAAYADDAIERMNSTIEMQRVATKNGGFTYYTPEKNAKRWVSK